MKITPEIEKAAAEADVEVNYVDDACSAVSIGPNGIRFESEPDVMAFLAAVIAAREFNL